MSKRRFYITTAIPYVNGDPHLGFALECVQADVLARHRRHRGDEVRFLSGTDDNSLKNVEAAEEAGLPVADFVAAKARRFAALRGPLALSYDDFIRTSIDPRHRPAVERLWRACAAAGDLYQHDYEGLYCTGCERFLAPDDLEGGVCPEHGEQPDHVSERNWFFRLSRYQDELVELLESGRLRVEPAHRRNEVVSFVRRGLVDFSVSRSRERAGGWGIPVPDDPGQVVYVWFDALANYISALGYGTGGELYRTWWEESDDRVHVIGKGIIRFHAVYWPAILLSAGEPTPTAIFVHDYLTAAGRKLSKSGGSSADPADVADRYGTDALRWWFVRDVPRVGDADFREELLAARANELADHVGNVVNRTIALVSRFRSPGADLGTPPEDAAELLTASGQASGAIDEALERFDFRAAADALWSVVSEANAFVSATRPWELARAQREGDTTVDARLDGILGALVTACDKVAEELCPFLPDAAERIEHALRQADPELGPSLFRKAGSLPERLLGSKPDDTAARPASRGRLALDHLE
jgi:methionyl-tRNA synthetase